MKNLSLFILIACLVCVFPAFSQTNDLLNTLKKKKVNTDTYIKSHNSELVILVKVPGKKALVPVKGDKWPDEIEYTFNILKDHSGKIIFIVQLFDSESGDWSITYKHYFDEKGNTYAFYSGQGVANDNVKGGSAHQSLLMYYNSDSKVINEIRQLTDGSGKALKGDKKLYDFPNDDFTIYKNLNDCLKGYNISFR